MKIGIIGHYGVSLLLAAHLTERNIQAEVVSFDELQMVYPEEREEAKMRDMAASITISHKGWPEPVVAFEQPRFRGYMDYQRRRFKLPPKAIGWK